MPKKTIKPANVAGHSKMDTQTKKVSGVLDLPLTGDILDDTYLIQEKVALLKTFLTFACDEYAFIIHASDKLEDDNEQEVIDLKPEVLRPYIEAGMKRPHIHFVFRASKRARLGTWVIRLAEVLGYSKPQQTLIHVECTKCFAYSIQYLIHLNEPEKFQYSPDSILTNLSRKMLNFYLESDGSFMDTETLINLCRSCGSQTEILSVIGLETFIAYRPVIATIFMEMRSNPCLLMNLNSEPEKPVRKAIES